MAGAGHWSGSGHGQAQLTITRPGMTLTATHHLPPPTENKTETKVEMDYSWVLTSTETSPSKIIPLNCGIQKFESWVSESGRVTRQTSLETPLSGPPPRNCRSTCSIMLTKATPPQQPLELPAVLPRVNKWRRNSHSNSEAASKIPALTPMKTAVIPPTVLRDAETQTLNRSEHRRISRERESKTGSTPRGSLRSNISDECGPVLRSKAKSSPPNLAVSPNKKEPRTIHIDVYCTGSEMDTTGDESSSQSSTSQTVYESANYKIRHHSKKTNSPPPHAHAQGQPAPSIRRRSTQDQVLLLTDLIRTEVEKSGIFRSRSPLEGRASGSECSEYPSTSGDISRNYTQSSFTSDATSVSVGNIFPLQRSGDLLRIWGGLGKSASPSLSEGEDLTNGRSDPDEAWWVDYLFAKRNDTSKEKTTQPQCSESESREESKFGAVIKGLRKPGHHIIGPPKNPQCPCHTCRQYFAQI